MDFKNLYKLMLEEVDDPATPSEYDLTYLDKASEQSEPILDDVTEEEETVEEVKGTTRLLSIDRRKANEEFKLISDDQTLKSIPLTRIKEILSKYKLKIEDEENVKFFKPNNNMDLKLINNKNKSISNSNLVLYWSRTSHGVFDINVYLS